MRGKRISVSCARAMLYRFPVAVAIIFIFCFLVFYDFCYLLLFKMLTVFYFRCFPYSIRYGNVGGNGKLVVLVVVCERGRCSFLARGGFFLNLFFLFGLFNVFFVYFSSFSSSMAITWRTFLVFFALPSLFASVSCLFFFVFPSV